MDREQKMEAMLLELRDELLSSYHGIMAAAQALDCTPKEDWPEGQTPTLMRCKADNIEQRVRRIDEALEPVECSIEKAPTP